MYVVYCVMMMDDDCISRNHNMLSDFLARSVAKVSISNRIKVGTRMLGTITTP